MSKKGTTIYINTGYLQPAYQQPQYYQQPAGYYPQPNYQQPQYCQQQQVYPQHPGYQQQQIYQPQQNYHQQQSFQPQPPYQPPPYEPPPYQPPPASLPPAQSCYPQPIPPPAQNIDQSKFTTAKSKLDSFQIQTSQMEKSVKSMLNTIKNMSNFYIQFTQQILDPWINDSNPEIKEADECLKRNGTEFNALVDALSNQLGPSFFNILRTHDAKLKELYLLDKKRIAAAKDLESKEYKYKSEAGSNNPNQAKLEAAKDLLNKAKNESDQLNNQYLNQVNTFESSRQKQLTGAFSSFYAMFCQFINNAAKLQPIDFPADSNEYSAQQQMQYTPISLSSSSNVINQQSYHDFQYGRQQSQPQIIPESPYDQSLQNNYQSSGPL